MKTIYRLIKDYIRINNYFKINKKVDNTTNIAKIYLDGK